MSPKANCIGHSCLGSQQSHSPRTLYFPITRFSPKRIFPTLRRVSYHHVTCLPSNPRSVVLFYVSLVSFSFLTRHCEQFARVLWWSRRETTHTWLLPTAVRPCAFTFSLSLASSYYVHARLGARGPRRAQRPCRALIAFRPPRVHCLRARLLPRATVAPQSAHAGAPPLPQILFCRLRTARTHFPRCRLRIKLPGNQLSLSL